MNNGDHPSVGLYRTGKITHSHFSPVGVCDGEQAESGGGRAAAVCVQAGAAAEPAGRESAGAGEEHSWKDLHRAQCVGGAGEPGTATGDGTDVNPGTGICWCSCGFSFLLFVYS